MWKTKFSVLDSNIILSILVIILFSLTAHAMPTRTIERLSLFVYDGTTVYEDRRLNNSVNNFPSDLTVSFIPSIKADGEMVWEWTLKNISKNTFNNLRITGVIDIDLDASLNTFFNEYGKLLTLNIPTGYIAPDKWEISEPGYLKGDLLSRAGKGNLSSRSELSLAAVDDPAMALSIDIGSLRAGEELKVTATLASKGINGLQQNDATNDNQNIFLLYAKKEQTGLAYPDVAQGGLLTTGASLTNGEVWVWGFRGSSQQGNGQMVVASQLAPAKVKSLTEVKALTGGAYHFVALDEKGDAYGWGQSGYGETGCAPTQGIYVSTPCKILKNAIQIAAGEYFSIALDANGQVWTWGHNLYGQLGDGGNKNSQKPIAVYLNGEKARLIGGAYEGAFAVTEAGHVWAWGDNEASGLGFKGTNYGVQQIIRSPKRVTNLDSYAERITYIAGGNGWGEALLDDGTVIGWGLHAALGIGVSTTRVSSPEPQVILKNIKQLYARYVGSFALTNEGKLYTWGQTGGSAFPMIYGHTATLRSLVNGKVTAIGGGKEHLFYKTEAGELYGVGYNDLYKLNQKKCCAPNVDWPGSEIKF